MSGRLHTEISFHPEMVTHIGTKWTQHQITSLIQNRALPLHQMTTQLYPVVDGQANASVFLLKNRFLALVLPNLNRSG